MIRRQYRTLNSMVAAYSINESTDLHPQPVAIESTAAAWNLEKYNMESTK